MQPVLTKTRDAAILHAMVVGNWALFRLVKLGDGRFKKAVTDFEATYQFRTRHAGRTLTFSGGRLSTRNGIASDADYELVLVDPPGVVKRMIENPDDMIKLLMENKIDQRGNNYFLFRYGYLLGLCDRFFREQLARLPFGKKAKAAG